MPRPRTSQPTRLAAPASRRAAVLLAAALVTLPLTAACTIDPVDRSAG